MKRLALLCALAIPCLASVATASPRTITPTFDAKVINVSDGDTVTALTTGNEKVRVRLANIDAPESSHGSCRPGQAFSAQSTQYLSDLIKGKTVRFQCSTVDRFGRSICDIEIQGTTANRLLVGAGFAWANRQNPTYLRDPGVAAAEKQAVARRVGLWSDPRAIPPWEWRKQVWDSKPGCKNFKRP